MKYQREFWVYQHRNVPEPWAFKIVKDVDTSRKPVMLFDMILYHVRAPAYGEGVYNIHPKHLNGFSGQAFELCKANGIPFTDSDAMQIDSAILDIIEDPRNYSD